MSQRKSGYERKEHDLYETPEWVTEALLPHIPKTMKIWEPACGNGKMSAVLAKDHHVVATDIFDYGNVTIDFLQTSAPVVNPDAIITNPPYELATEFIEQALEFQKETNGLVAMLLRTDFDHAKSRRHLFADHQAFAKKLVLTKRIKWFLDSKGQPSFNHAWFVWDWKNLESPKLAYGPIYPGG